MGALRIIVNDIAASSGGALSVLNDFYDSIIENDDKNEWIFLLSGSHFRETKNIKILDYSNLKNSWLKRLFFDLFIGKFKINKLKPDLYVSLQNTSTIGVLCPQIVYLHQAIPYQKDVVFSFFKRKEFKLAIYQKIIGKILNFLFKYSKSSIVVQTNWMKKSLSKYVDNDITIIHPSVNIEDSKDIEINKAHFFYPAAYVSYKNHKLIFDCVDKLVNNGYEDFKVTLTIPSTNLMNKNKYIFLNSIPREKVYELYNKTILLFPSYLEAYGLPLLEARQSNSIIFASDTVFSKEILENYPNVYYFDFKDVNELYLLMEKAINGNLKYNEYSNPKEYSDKDFKLYDYVVNFMESN